MIVILTLLTVAFYHMAIRKDLQAGSLTSLLLAILLRDQAGWIIGLIAGGFVVSISNYLSLHGGVK